RERPSAARDGVDRRAVGADRYHGGGVEVGHRRAVEGAPRGHGDRVHGLVGGPEERGELAVGRDRRGERDESVLAVGAELPGVGLVDG
ncbi:hypothetical protein NPS74_22475, partial [Cutibacterium acnes subsp. acnes]|nr:hypothetical protein [Cutibacterium acnes subsp. acnes]